MVTKKKGKSLNLLGDPPIIVTGGGGESIMAAKNTISIEYTDAVTGRTKNVKAKNNAAVQIKEVVVTVEGQNSGGPVTSLPAVRLSGFDFYNVTIKFET